MKHPHITNTDLHHFQTDVLDASHATPILVDFWAEWCSPCLVIAPVLEKLMTEYDGAVKLVKLEVDEGENMKLAGRYWWSNKAVLMGSALLWCFAVRRRAQAMARSLSSTATPPWDTTGAPEGLACQRSWLRYPSSEGLWPFTSRCALP